MKQSRKKVNEINRSTTGGSTSILTCLDDLKKNQIDLCRNFSGLEKPKNNTVGQESSFSLDLFDNMRSQIEFNLMKNISEKLDQIIDAKVQESLQLQSRNYSNDEIRTELTMMMEERDMRFTNNLQHLMENITAT